MASERGVQVDIRTRLTLALVSVALLSMFLLGTFAYNVASEMLQDISERQLDALAESKKQDLEQVIAGWRNHVRLIRSRTQLRIQLNELQVSNQPETLDQIRRILADAQESTEYVQRITLFDRRGTEIAAAGSATQEAMPSTSPDPDEVDYAGFYIGVDGRPKVVFNSGLRLDEDSIGSVEVVIDVTNVESIARNYRGLGETGETLIVGEDETGTLVLLHTLRHMQRRPDWAQPPDYIQAAFTGDARTFTEDVVDYRNREVWAATRYVPPVDWGLVVKVDAEEETARARELREDMIDLGLALGAFAVVGGTMLGFYLARPIRDLAHAVERIKLGERSLRLDDSAEDEVGLLAEALNELLDKLDTTGRPTGDDERDT